MSESSPTPNNSQISPKQAESNAVDYQIINEILSGNKDAFALLQKKYQRQITSLLRKMVRDEDDVADLVQDTFIKAYRALPTFQQEHSFEKWLYKIASNTCIDYLRRKRFAMLSIDRTFTNDDGSESSMEFEDPDSPQPDAHLLSVERTELLKIAFDELPEKYQLVIKMRHEEELEYNEIAEQLNLPLGTVKAHIFRARAMMLQSLKKHRHIFRP